MPIQAVIDLGKQAGKTAKEAEDLWDKAKDIAAKDGKEDKWNYIMGVFKKSLGLGEETTTTANIASRPMPLVKPKKKLSTKEIIDRLRNGEDIEDLIKEILGK